MELRYFHSLDLPRFYVLCRGKSTRKTGVCRAGVDSRFSGTLVQKVRNRKTTYRPVDSSRGSTVNSVYSTVRYAFPTGANQTANSHKSQEPTSNSHKSQPTVATMHSNQEKIQSRMVPSSDGSTNNPSVHDDTLEKDVNLEGAEEAMPSISGSETESTRSHESNADAAESKTSWWRRLVILSLCAIFLIVLPISIRFAVADENKNGGEGEVGPYYRSSHFGGSPSCEDCGGRRYGEHVKMTADGNRIFVSTWADDGLVEVWDYDTETGDWILKNKLILHIPPAAGTDEGSVALLDLAINREGSRMVLSTISSSTNAMRNERLVRVLEDATGDGTDWVQIGETMDSYELGLYNEFIKDIYKRDNTTAAEGWGMTLDMSTDGNIIVVAAPHADRDPYELYSYDLLVGAVQAYQHVDSIKSGDAQAGNSANRTWIPMGQTLFGDFKESQMGERLALSGDGLRLIVSENDRAGYFKAYVYDYDGTEWKKNGWDSLFVDDVDRLSDVVALSRDGQVLALAQADESPSAYSDLPYRGTVTIYKYDSEEMKYREVQTLQGEVAFQHFGTSIALSDDYTLIVGSANSYYSKVKYDRLEVFRLNETEDTWKRVGPAFGRNVETGWRAVDISSDGARIVAGAYYEGLELPSGNRIWSSGLVDVYELNDE